MRMAGPALRSVVYNLLSNALKYSRPGQPPHLRLHSALVGGLAVLHVADNGRGLDLARHRADLFQLFRRFHPDVEGSGTGLYLVNRLVQQAGGRVEVESVVGVGTTFCVLLPS
jgi:phosphoserine phosphatase RsbU/P